MSTEKSDKREKWKQFLQRVVHAIKYLSGQNLWFRGHREDVDSANRGNFLEL